jgi:hypothetical protein
MYLFWARVPFEWLIVDLPKVYFEEPPSFIKIDGYEDGNLIFVDVFRCDQLTSHFPRSIRSLYEADTTHPTVLQIDSGKPFPR